MYFNLFFQLKCYLTNMTAIEAPRGGPTIRQCTFDEVFNLPLYECYLVLDTRSDTTGKTIATAHRLPETDDYEKSITNFMINMEEQLTWPEQWKSVVIFDDGTLSDYTMKVAESVKQSLIAGANTTGHDRANLFATVHEIWLLAGGYDAFESSFPQLCGVDAEDLTPSPCLVMPGLFMASRAMDLDLPTLRHWGITHLICDNETIIPPIDGFMNLQISFADDNNEDFSPSFTPAHLFISEALSTPGNKVLVKFWGRTRSATLLAAHIMKTLGVSGPAAIEYIQKKCYRTIDKKLVSFDQLEEWRVGRLQ